MQTVTIKVKESVTQKQCLCGHAGGAYIGIDGMWYACCSNSNCFIKTKSKLTKADAIEEWNQMIEARMN